MHATLALLTLALSAPQNDFEVGAQGVFRATHPAAVHSPDGAWSLEVRPTGGDLTHVESSLELRSEAGALTRLESITGTGFLVSNLGQVIVTEATHAEFVPVRLSVLDDQGRVRHSERVPVLTDATLSADGDQVAFRTHDEVAVLDLVTFDRTHHPRLARFAVDADGGVAGIDPSTGELVAPDGRRHVLAAGARKLAFAPNGDLYVLSAGALDRLPVLGDVLVRRFVLAGGGDGAHLRDLIVTEDAVHLGVRLQGAGRSLGRHLRLDHDAREAVVLHEEALQLPAHVPTPPSLPGQIPWPLAPNAQHPIGNTYAEYQRYGGSPYMHPGIDVLGQVGQPVFAVEDGEVKAVLTTSGQYHWRVATGQPGSGTTTGYLYAHLDQPTITVNVGDAIVEGQYLGDLVAWPVANFTHVHFARIQDTGNQWFGDWLCTDNPHCDLVNATEATAPIFENAVPGALFAFCSNETSNYWNPNNLKGAVDIIVHVGDKLDSSWTCAIQELRFTIAPVLDPDSPVVADRLAVRFDMHLDTYSDGPFDPFLVDLLYKEDSTCNTDGDYGSREFFHVITNSDGDEVYEASDAAQAWDTTQVPNGAYLIEVTARDVAGNETTAAMAVTVNN